MLNRLVLKGGNIRLYDGWVLEGGINALFGKPRTGKSYLLTSLCLRIAKNNPDVMVFYLDWNNPITQPKVTKLPTVLINLKIDNFFFLSPVFNNKINEMFKEYDIDSKPNRAVRLLNLINKTVHEEKIVIVFDTLVDFMKNYYLTQGGFKEIKKTIQYMKEYTNRITYILPFHFDRWTERYSKKRFEFRNLLDVIYEVSSVNKKDGHLILQSIKCDKYPCVDKSRIDYHYVGYYDYRMVDFRLDNEIKKRVVFHAIEILRKSDAPYLQEQLAISVAKRVNVGIKKTRYILKEFANDLFNVQHGKRNALYYSLNKNSQVLKYFKTNEKVVRIGGRDERTRERTKKND